MDKILNNPRVNIYGNSGMINKYIYMKREDKENTMYFIYKINSILNDKFPVIYECNRLYILIIPKDKNKENIVKDDLTKLELTNNDVLYQMSIDEYLGIFKIFVNYDGTKMKLSNNVFEN